MYVGLCFTEHKNFDISHIETPVNANRLEQLLRESKYNQEETKYLVTGSKHGFSLEYEDPLIRQDTSKNLPFHVGDKFDLWAKIMKEVNLKRYAGPFKKVLFENFIQSPIGLVPKAGGKTRLIFHLSYDFKESGLKSVNAYTPEHKCSVRYKDLDHAVKQSLNLLKQLSAVEVKGSKPIIWYRKTDMEAAYHVLPLSPKVYWILVMKVRHPTTNELYYFVDKCLPFGHSFSFQML